MPNIIAGRRAAPEFVQRECSPRRLVPALEELLRDAGRRDEQTRSFREIATRLGRGGPPPSERAAGVILDLIEARAQPGRGQQSAGC